MRVVVAASLLFITLQSVTVLLILDYFPTLQRSPPAIASVGTVCLGLCSLLAFGLFRQLGFRASASGVFFTVTCWSACIDLVLALSLLGVTRLGRFYMETGEEYFKTSYGVACLGWDGTFHLLLQLYLAYATILGAPRLVTGLFWAGSVINSMPPLLLGAATGAFSASIKPSTALNVPYVLAPIAYALAICQTPLKATQRESISVSRVAEVTCGVGHAAAIALHTLRAMVVLGSQAAVARWWVTGVEPVLGQVWLDDYGVLKVQLVQYFFYFVPYHAWALAQIIAGRRSVALAKAAVMVAGAYSQGQVCCLAIGSYQLTDFGVLAPRYAPPESFAVNLGLLWLSLFDASVCWQCTVVRGHRE